MRGKIQIRIIVFHNSYYCQVPKNDNEAHNPNKYFQPIWIHPPLPPPPHHHNNIFTSFYDSSPAHEVLKQKNTFNNRAMSIMANIPFVESYCENKLIVAWRVEYCRVARSGGLIRRLHVSRSLNSVHFFQVNKKAESCANHVKAGVFRTTWVLHLLILRTLQPD